MLVASLDPEIYLKSQRTQRRMIDALTKAITARFEGRVEISRLPGHRLAVEAPQEDAIERLQNIFGVRAVEVVEKVEVRGVDHLAGAVAARFADAVKGRTFAVRPTRSGSHDWTSQDLAVASGTLLVGAGGRVDLSNPQFTVRIRIVGDTAFLTLHSLPGLGGLPAGTQGKALAMFSGGIDSPVACYMVQRRGVLLDYLHFSLGCGQADHAAGIAHLMHDRFGAGAEPTLHIVDLESAVAQIQARVPGRERQMVLKGVMYRAAQAIAVSTPGVRALVTGESIGQVSTQTLDNLTSLDRIVEMPVLRPLIGLDKESIMAEARTIGTLDLSARTRETCDISAGARVSVSTSPAKLAALLDEIDDLIDHAVTTTKSMRLDDWVPGT